MQQSLTALHPGTAFFLLNVNKNVNRHMLPEQTCFTEVKHLLQCIISFHNGRFEESKGLCSRDVICTCSLPVIFRAWQHLKWLNYPQLAAKGVCSFESFVRYLYKFLSLNDSSTQRHRLLVLMFNQSEQHFLHLSII